jgi:hypothetical protein
LSSGKLDLNASVRNDKFNSTLVNSNISFPNFDTETTWDPSSTNFSQMNLEINELYDKTFEIHLLLLRNNGKLSNKAKLEYCKVERNYMKLYLKAIIKKNQKFPHFFV